VPGEGGSGNVEMGREGVEFLEVEGKVPSECEWRTTQEFDSRKKLKFLEEQLWAQVLE